MRVPLCLLLLSFLSACSEPGVETVFDPCSPLAIAYASGTEASEIRAIEGAIVAWNEVLPTQIQVGEAGADVPTLGISFDTGDTFYRAIYWDAIGQISVSRRHLSADSLAPAIAHELGHAFGLLHVSADERLSVMNVGNLEVAPTSLDAEEVAAMWPACAEPSAASSVAAGLTADSR